MDLFAIAARKKFRFPSPVGDLTAEQLWDLPLLARETRQIKVDLDTVARGINTELKSVTEESFVAVKPNPRQKELADKLEIVKAVIGVKQEEAAKAAAAVVRAEKRRKLVDALARQEDKALYEASKDDLVKQLAELDQDEQAQAA